MLPTDNEPINILTGGHGRADPALAAADVSVNIEHKELSTWVTGVDYD